MMKCTSCGTMLAPGATTCPNCGAATPYNTNEESSPYVEFGPIKDRVSAPSYTPGEESIPYIDYGPLRETVSKPPSSAAGTPLQPGSNTVQGLPPTGYRPQSYGGTQTPPIVPPSVPPQQELRPQRRFPAGIMALLILLALLIIGASLLTYFLAVRRPAELQAQTTATAQAVLTARVQSTAQANAHATATTAAMTPQDIYNQVTSGTPAFSDQLNGQSSNNWIVRSGQDSSCAFSGGAYHAKISRKPYIVLCSALVGPFSNFAMQVQMTLKGDGGGLGFRATNSSTNQLEGYFLTIMSVGNYSLSVNTGGPQDKALLQGFSSAIQTAPNQPNILTIIARSSTIYLYINKQYINKASDATYSSGGIGLLALDIANPTDAAFSNLQVWAL